MAAEDFAILVGVSRYRDTGKYPTLQGPGNDVLAIKKWLEDGCGVPPERVVPLASPAELIALPDEGWPLSTRWIPNEDDFKEAFKGAVYDSTGKVVRNEGRLYLYFSGHGFSQQKDQTASAGLYCASSFGDVIDSVAGTVYAHAAKSVRAYKQVVLIMDCCRDSEANVEYRGTGTNKYEYEDSEDVQLYAVYAAPKRGKAQERSMPELDGAVSGLMTQAWLRGVREAPCDVLGRVHGKVLMQYIGFKWEKWYPTDTPPAPRIVAPDKGDVAFPSGKTLVKQKFLVPTGVANGAQYGLRATCLNSAATLGPESIEWVDGNFSWECHVALTLNEQGLREFYLRLEPVSHTLHTPTSQIPVVFTPGADNAITL